VTRWNLIGLACLSVMLVLGLWQLATDHPLLPPPATGSLLLLAGTLFGVRIGYESARRFADEVKRMNRIVADQNRDLVDLNLRLLKERLTAYDTTAKTREQSSIES
jgi:hypothetical protein